MKKNIIFCFLLYSGMALSCVKDVSVFKLEQKSITDFFEIKSSTIKNQVVLSFKLINKTTSQLQQESLYLDTLKQLTGILSDKKCSADQVFFFLDKTNYNIASRDLLVLKPQMQKEIFWKNQIFLRTSKVEVK